MSLKEPREELFVKPLTRVRALHPKKLLNVTKQIVDIDICSYHMLSRMPIQLKPTKLILTYHKCYRCHWFVLIKPRQHNIWLLCEQVEGVDYVKFLSLTDALVHIDGNVAKASSISKSEINAVMTLAP